MKFVLLKDTLYTYITPVVIVLNYCYFYLISIYYEHYSLSLDPPFHLCVFLFIHTVLMYLCFQGLQHARERKQGFLRVFYYLFRYIKVITSVGIMLLVLLFSGSQGMWTT